MDAQKLKEEQLKLEIKISKEYGKEYINELRALFENNQSEKLGFKLKELAKHREAIDSQMKSDLELQSAKQTVKVLKEPYSEQLRDNKCKARYVALLIQELDDFE